MDKLKKFIDKLTTREKKDLEPILVKLKKLDFRELDVKKLKNTEGLYRVRKGNIRIIYTLKNGVVSLISIERRSDNSYKNL